MKVYPERYRCGKMSCSSSREPGVSELVPLSVIRSLTCVQQIEYRYEGLALRAVDINSYIIAAMSPEISQYRRLTLECIFFFFHPSSPGIGIFCRGVLFTLKRYMRILTVTSSCVSVTSVGTRASVYWLTITESRQVSEVVYQLIAKVSSLFTRVEI